MKKASELKSLWVYSIQEIAQKLNVIWTQTKRWNLLTWKYINTLFIKSLYAWVIESFSLNRKWQVY